MDWNEHGGECCGVSHVLNFPYKADRAELDRCVKWAIRTIEEPARERVEEDLADYRNNHEYRRELRPIRPWTIRGRFGHLIEVVLTDDQMVEWASTLKEYGFRLGPRWLNDNSGNYCNLLTYQTKKPSHPRPFEW